MSTKSNKKRGPAGDFVGEREAFLEVFLPTYLDASKRGKTRGIWTNFFISYWAKFPWRLPLKQDPSPLDPLDYSRAPESPEEESEKARIITEIEGKLGRWFGRHGKRGKMGGGNPWSEFLKRFCKPATAAPRRMADWQHYMQQEGIKEQINDIFETRKAGVAKNILVKLRGEIARELLSEESEETQERIKEETDARHAALAEKHEDALEGLPPLDEEGLDEARQRFSGLVGPLLQGLAAYTGYEITLLAGRVKLGEKSIDIDALSMHAGVTDTTPPSLDFSKADEKVYADVMRKFSHFVWGAHEFRNGKTASTSTSTSTSAEAAGGSSNQSTVPPAGSAPMPPSGAGHVGAAGPSISSMPLTSAAGGSAEPGNHTVAPNSFNDEDVLQHLGAQLRWDDGLPSFREVREGATETDGLSSFGNSVFSTGTSDFDTSEGDFDDRRASNSSDTEFNFPDELIPGPEAVGFSLPSPVIDPIDPYAVGFAAAPCRELRMRLDGLSEDERATRVLELQLLSAEELERQNNNARNYYMLAGLGLGEKEKETLWGGTIAAPKRKAATQGKAKAKSKKAKKSVEVEESSGSGSGSESESEKEGEGTGKKAAGETRTAITERQKAGSGKTARVGGARANVPQPKDWASKARSLLENNNTFGAPWTALIQSWYKREEAAGFEGTRQAHSATKRPGEVTYWVSRARKGTPKLGSTDEFGKTWWGWWIDINPRVRGEQRPLQRVDVTDWEGMDLYGQNGFLNVLVTLKWWRDALETETSEWMEAVDDVTWVIEKLRLQATVVNVLPAEKLHTPCKDPGAGGPATSIQDAAPAVNMGSNTGQATVGDTQIAPTNVYPASTSSSGPEWPGSNQMSAAAESLDSTRAQRARAAGLSEEEQYEIDMDGDADAEEEQ